MRLRVAKPSGPVAYSDVSGALSTGEVRNTDERKVSCGNRRPRLSQKRRDQAPPASTAALQGIRPFSVITAEMRPPDVSIPRAAQFCITRPPDRCTARAIAGVALDGSARPSLLV